MAIDTRPRTPASQGATRVAPRPAPGRAPARPVTAPRHTRPVTRPAPAPVTRPGPKPPGPGAPPRARAHRMPFILLLVGLLGGALISLLVISTVLAQGSFRITRLQEQDASLARQQQILTNQVAQAANPAVIARKATQLGMRPNPRLGFIDLKTGKIVMGKPTRAETVAGVPGYTP